jgi:cytochrome oxidase Cu insertion factor (SCO1/SenC/PrrC family)
MKRPTIFLLLFVFFLAGRASIVFAQFSQARVAEFKTPVAAPDFTLRELGGGEISLKAFKGKVVILNFFTTW